jgi:hypothetical protein
MINNDVTRRKFLLLAMGLAGSMALPLRAASDDTATAGYCWDSFVLRMRDLADDYIAGLVTHDEVAQHGLEYMKALDIDSSSFADAVAAAYESGNEYWLWQRMLKKDNVNGGVLNIDNNKLVQLHDHPGATGMLRIISGEAEVWQYDRVSTSSDGLTARLKRVSHRSLKPGDTAFVSPDKGNIHALRSITTECRMLDFFIPPYEQNLRTWFEPLDKNWQALEQITCRCISQYELARS